MCEDFLREKPYLLNVSEATLTWYEQALRWLPNPNPDEREIRDVVIRKREAGIKPSSVNSYRTALNSYLHWKSATAKPCGPQCSHPRIPKMKEPQAIPQTFSKEDIGKLIAWKPKR